jgi:hypothetical protein
MHEYPRNATFDSVSERRVSALADFGFTQRQREFLVTVMVHAGCFLERQYCAFTGTARGQNSREFVARLVARGLARAIEPGPVRRGRLFFPEGIAYDGIRFNRTAVTAPLFSYLAPSEGADEKVVSRLGIEPRTRRLRVTGKASAAVHRVRFVR